MLGEWYATVIFWRPQVALFVSETTLLPVFVPLAPASSVIRRMPTELADLLRRQEVPSAFIDNELSKMNEAVCVPTASPSTLGVLNEYVFLAGHAHVERAGPPDSAWLEDWLAQTPMGPLHKRYGSPDRTWPGATLSASNSSRFASVSSEVDPCVTTHTPVMPEQSTVLNRPAGSDTRRYTGRVDKLGSPL